jgi:DNA-binding ferritin-like protein
VHRSSPRSRPRPALRRSVRFEKQIRAAYANECGGTTLRSIGQIGRLQRVLDNDADFVTPIDMLAELRDDNKQLAASLRETHALCEKHDERPD